MKISKYLLCCVILILVLSSNISSQNISYGIEIIELDLDDEYVLIKNKSRYTVSLKGWMLKDNLDKKNKQYYYTFDKLRLKQNEVLQVISGKLNGDYKQNVDGVDYIVRAWDRSVWNNTGDIAYLYDYNNKLVSQLNMEK